MRAYNLEIRKKTAFQNCSEPVASFPIFAFNCNRYTRIVSEITYRVVLNVFVNCKRKDTDFIWKYQRAQEANQANEANEREKDEEE